MNGYLLDTHVLLWASGLTSKLSTRARFILERENSQKYISIASVWEIAIKVSLGKLELPVSVEKYFSEVRADLKLSILQIELEHVLKIEKMPLTHRDPFDRILISQAISEDLTILSKDDAFDGYDVVRVW
jgi:PIN domain nuclease of toxin-antitoxin system